MQHRGQLQKRSSLPPLTKGAALLEHGVSPGGLLLAKGQRLPNNGKKRERRGEEEQEEGKGKLCEAEHTVG